MSGKSVTLTFGEPEAPPAAGRAADPASMTRDERRSANWQARLIAYCIGLPSILAIVFVGLVDLLHAWQAASDIQTGLAWALGLTTVTIFAAGLPVAWALTREHYRIVAQATLLLWLACLGMNAAIMSGFTRHEPTSQAIAAQVPAVPEPGLWDRLARPFLSDEQGEELYNPSPRIHRW
jgi:hypothetical protein